MKTKIDTFVKAHKLNCSTRSDSKAVCDCGFEEVLAENETIKSLSPRFPRCELLRLIGFVPTCKVTCVRQKDGRKRWIKCWLIFFEEEPTETTAQGRLL